MAAFDLPLAGSGLPTETGIPYIGAQDNNGRIAVGAGMYFKNASGLWVPVSATDRLPVDAQLTGSSVPDAQALPMTPAQKDVVARAIDAIIAEIGAENIVLFLPMFETSGSKVYDLLNRSTSFSVKGATLGVPGPFGTAIAFDGVDDHLIENPEWAYTSGTGARALQAGRMLAQRLDTKQSGLVSKIRLPLRLVGSLPSATVKVEIRGDSGGVPAASAITNGVSSSIACSAISTNTHFYVCFPFPNLPSTNYGTAYWIVLMYDNATGVDVNNYIELGIDSAGGYGQPFAGHDGTAWNAIAGQNARFEVYGRNLYMDSDATLIVAVRDDSSSPTAYRTAVSVGAEVGMAVLRQHATFGYQTYFHDTAERFTNERLVFRGGQQTWKTYALSVSKAASTNKLKSYVDGTNVSVNGGAGAIGDAGVGVVSNAQAMVVGAGIITSGQVGPGGFTYWQGRVGPVILCRTVLTDQQIARVHRHIMALRRYNAGV